MLTHSPPLRLETKAQGDAWAVTGYLTVYNQPDEVGDVIAPGAADRSLDGGRKVKFLFGHDERQIVGPPLEVTSDSTGLHASGRISKTALGQDVHTLLEDGGLDSWSIGYVTEQAHWVDNWQQTGQRVRLVKQLALYEGSLVAVPMQPRARVLSVKARGLTLERKGAVGVHHTATDDGAWDGPANEARVKSDQSAAYYRRIYAWQDTASGSSTKAGWRFIHHLVNGDGDPGAASIKACQSGIGVLNGGRGGTTIPSADQRGVWSHLAAHLRDAGLEPPELKRLFGLERKDALLLGPVTGSYEALTDSVEDALEDQAGAFGWGDGAAVAVVATYPEYVIAAICPLDADDDDGMGLYAGPPEPDYYRVPYTFQADGQVSLGTPVAVQLGFLPVQTAAQPSVAPTERLAAVRLALVQHRAHYLGARFGEGALS